jgi:type I restriction enzyme M protein
VTARSCVPRRPGRRAAGYTKTQPVHYEEFAACATWWINREENERAWRVPADEILSNNCNLDRKNPRGKVDITHLPPEQLVESILEKERRIGEIMEGIRKLLGGASS